MHWLELAPKMFCYCLYMLSCQKLEPSLKFSVAVRDAACLLFNYYLIVHFRPLLLMLFGSRLLKYFNQISLKLETFLSLENLNLITFFLSSFKNMFFAYHVALVTFQVPSAAAQTRAHLHFADVFNSGNVYASIEVQPDGNFQFQRLLPDFVLYT